MVVGLPDVYQPAQQLLDKLVAYDFSERLTIFHCRTCGAQMFFRCWKDSEDHSKGAVWDAACGTLPKADGIFVVECHEHIADTLDGGFSDFLPHVNGELVKRWPHHRRKVDGMANFKDEQLPLCWQDSSRSIPDPNPTDKLYCHCKCAGVEFWISRSWGPEVDSSSEEIGVSADSNRKFHASVCSCNKCRFSTGMEWAEWASIPTTNIWADADLTQPFRLASGAIQHYRSSSKAVRYFCQICGAATFYSQDKSPEIMKVAVGVLDAPEGARAESWLDIDTSAF